MKLLAVLVVAGLAFWFIGARIVDRGSDVNAVAQSTNDNINSVTRVLREATANAQRQSSSADTWQGKVNASCSRTSVALSRLHASRSLDGIAAYLGRALPIVRRQHERVVARLPADEASAATRARRASAKHEAVREARGHPRARPSSSPPRGHDRDARRSRRPPLTRTRGEPQSHSSGPDRVHPSLLGHPALARSARSGLLGKKPSHPASDRAPNLRVNPQGGGGGCRSSLNGWDVSEDTWITASAKRKAP